MARYFKREGRGKGYEDVTREVAALRADLEQTTDERNALLHARTALRDELEKFADEAEKDAAEILALRAERDEINEEANALSREATRLAAELGRVATERDAYRDELYECQRERDSWNIDVMHMQPVVVAAKSWASRRRSEPGVPGRRARRLIDAVDAYRVATSEQEAPVCSCGKPERGRGPWHAPGRCSLYAGALDLPIEASEQEASDHAG